MMEALFSVKGHEEIGQTHMREISFKHDETFLYCKDQQTLQTSSPESLLSLHHQRY